MSGGSEPLLLAVETATPTWSLALLQGDTLRAHLTRGPSEPAAEQLLPSIAALLAEAGVDLAAVEAFAVSIGPGSFTGLRIGLATVKGLAFDPERPVAPVSTLAALAAGARPQALPIAALLDARRGEVYAAVYPPEAEGAGAPLLEEGLFRPDELAAALPVPCVLVGDGVAWVEAELRQRHGDAVTLAEGAPQAPCAVSVGRLGALLLRSGGGLPAERLQPRYLRRAEAEVRRTGQRSEPRARRSTL